MLTLAQGKENLRRLIDSLSEESDRNESQTRFHIIDIVLKDCLGWEGEIEVENYEEKGFTDYELGSPRIAILEAKRQGRTFELPAGYSKKIVVDLKSLMQFSVETSNAIEQVQHYCSLRGVPVAIISNGNQYIAFLATRTDGKSIFEGDAIVFHSLENIYEKFNEVWQLLSIQGVKEHNLFRRLNNIEKGIPKKLSSYLLNYPKARYRSETQTSLRSLSELFIQDIVENEELEENFIKECYCESGELEQYSLLSKNILKKRYSALFHDDEQSPTLLPVKDKKHNNLTLDTIAGSLSHRPIVLLGDVGVGKTSFIKNLIYNTATSEFKNSITIYINLGSEGALTSNLKDFVIREIEEQLYEVHDIHLYDFDIIRGIYASEITKFDRGIKGQLKQADPKRYEEALLDHLDEMSKEKDQHLKKAINYYSKSTKRQFIVIIDNADQREYETQQQAFIISHELAKNWQSLVFIALRPNTFYRSQRSGALSAYPHKIFTIEPPRIDKIIEKRLNYALEISEGKIPIETFSTLKSMNLTLFLKALLDSLLHNSELYEFLSNITGGNIRKSIDLVAKFIGSPNVDCEKIIEIMKRKNEYRIPLHEFTKSALLGDYGHYHPDHSIAINMYEVSHSEAKEHFLKPLLLAFIDSNSPLKDSNYFYSTDNIFKEMQNYGFSVTQTENNLRLLTNRKLIETSQRVTFEEDEEGILFGELPRQFRITSIGAYHLKKWIGNFAYLDAMVFDTPIFNEDLIQPMIKKSESFYISDRYERTVKFKEYLLTVWNQFNLESSYFDFPTVVSNEKQSFDTVERAVGRMQKS